MRKDTQVRELAAASMISAPAPDNEEDRLEALRILGILDTVPEQSFDDLTLLAASVCATPVSFVSLIDRDRQWFKSHHGIAIEQTGRDVAFCAHAILEPQQIMEVPDAAADNRFADNPLILGEPRFRFYVGVPLVTEAATRSARSASSTTSPDSSSRANARRCSRRSSRHAPIRPSSRNTRAAGAG